MAEKTQRVIDGKGLPLMDGWMEIGDTSLLLYEDVLRLDFNHQTYAVYRAYDGKVYASDGICTHGNAHLADGLVKGNLVECGKHNGRFDIRDGSPQRLPVCVGIKTYSVRENGAKLLVNLSAAGGYGVTRAAEAHIFRVVSNRNVANFIKELVLEPVADQSLPTYQAGDYLQVDIPEYEERTLQNVKVEGKYMPAWQAMNVFDLNAANPTACRRNCSMAGNPAVDNTLKFNVRLALPPRGVDCYAGVGSSYLFGLKPGDTISAIGPFGEFHVRETGREMVYLGGGAGMAPLRSHLSYLFETLGTTAKISYWYGARSLDELFYRKYFEDLSGKFPNFSFQVGLSEPQPEDHWDGHTGFIHEILKREYLDSHTDPKSINYFLCGPPAMIKAAVNMLKGLGVNPEQIAYDEF